MAPSVLYNKHEEYVIPVKVYTCTMNNIFFDYPITSILNDTNTCISLYDMVYYYSFTFSMLIYYCNFVRKTRGNPDDDFIKMKNK